MMGLYTSKPNTSLDMREVSIRSSLCGYQKWCRVSSTGNAAQPMAFFRSPHRERLAAGSAQDGHPQVLVVPEALEVISQFLVHRRAERVELGRPVDDQVCEVINLFQEDVTVCAVLDPAADITLGVAQIGDASHGK